MHATGIFMWYKTVNNTHIFSCRGRFTLFGTERRCSLFWKIHNSKNIVLRKGIYTLFKPLYYLCKIFGLPSYSYVADRLNNSVSLDYGYLNYILRVTVTWLVIFAVGLHHQIPTLRRFDSSSETLFFAWKLYNLPSYTSSIVAVV
jgi:hypothetical protein